MSFVVAQGPVTVCQLADELDAVLGLYRAVKPLRVLELGTASGGTLYHWLRDATPGAHVVTVDLASPDYESSEHLYAGWTPDGVTVSQIRGSTHDRDTLAACRMLGPYEWLFIDACHVYEDARQDWLDYGPLVEPGGLVLFHDIALRRDYGDGKQAGVERLWRELQAAGYWTHEIRAAPNLREYGIGVLTRV